MGRVNLTLRIDSSLYEELRRLAEERGLSISKLVEEMLAVAQTRGTDTQARGTRSGIDVKELARAINEALNRVDNVLSPYMSKLDSIDRLIDQVVNRLNSIENRIASVEKSLERIERSITRRRYRSYRKYGYGAEEGDIEEQG